MSELDSIEERMDRLIERAKVKPSDADIQRLVEAAEKALFEFKCDAYEDAGCVHCRLSGALAPFRKEKQ